MRREVEVAGGVDRHRRVTVVRQVPEQEELDLGVGVEGEAGVGGLAERAAQHVARVGPRGRAVGHRDVAEHPRRAGRAVRLAPRQDLERRRVGLGEHVALVHPGEALDRRAVEADALGEGALQLGRRDRHRLQRAEHVGEPQPHEADVALLQRPEDELLLLVQSACAPRSEGHLGLAGPPESAGAVPHDRASPRCVQHATDLPVPPLDPVGVRRPHVTPLGAWPSSSITVVNGTPAAGSQLASRRRRWWRCRTVSTPAGQERAPPGMKRRAQASAALVRWKTSPSAPAGKLPDGPQASTRTAGSGTVPHALRRLRRPEERGPAGRRRAA